MYIVDNYLLAIIFCFITMLCWGSWGNTQKLASKTWRYEYFTGTMYLVSYFAHYFSLSPWEAMAKMDVAS